MGEKLQDQLAKHEALRAALITGVGELSYTQLEFIVMIINLFRETRGFLPIPDTPRIESV